MFIWHFRRSNRTEPDRTGPPTPLSAAGGGGADGTGSHQSSHEYLLHRCRRRVILRRASNVNHSNIRRRRRRLRCRRARANEMTFAGKQCQLELTIEFAARIHFPSARLIPVPAARRLRSSPSRWAASRSAPPSYRRSPRSRKRPTLDDSARAARLRATRAARKPAPAEEARRRLAVAKGSRPAGQPTACVVRTLDCTLAGNSICVGPARLGSA